MTKYQRIKAKSASERGRARARRRWELDRARRDALARMVETQPQRVAVRVVVVGEVDAIVTELVLFRGADWRDLKRLRRQAAEAIARAAFQAGRAPP